MNLNKILKKGKSWRLSKNDKSILNRTDLTNLLEETIYFRGGRQGLRNTKEGKVELFIYDKLNENPSQLKPTELLKFKKFNLN